MILSNQRTIFRGVSLKYKEFPFVVSAMRKNEITYLETFFTEHYGEKLLDYYRAKIFSMPKSDITFFSEVDYLSAWGWFLSLINIAVKANNQKELLNNIRYTSVITAFENFVSENMEYFPESLYTMTANIFSTNDKYDKFTHQATSNTSVSEMVYGFEYFQHINYDLRTKDMNYNPFPTMVMDWTEDVAIANEFSQNGIVVSIDYDKYKQLIYDEWYEFLMAADIASAMPGFTPYFDYHFAFSKKNINMQKQKGIVMFWPWAYTIEELERNELGRKLGFNVIKML